MSELEAKIVWLEEELRRAMLERDVPALDKLISDDLILRNHEGLLCSKEEDLSLYKGEGLRFSLLEQIELTVTVFGDVCIAFSKMRMEGDLHESSFGTNACFTRTWIFDSKRWVIVAVHVSLCV